jgi:hypothetical protein
VAVPGRDIGSGQRPTVAHEESTCPGGEHLPGDGGDGRWLRLAVVGERERRPPAATEAAAPDEVADENVAARQLDDGGAPGVPAERTHHPDPADAREVELTVDGRSP